MTKPADAPELPGYAAVAAIAARLGVTRQTVHQMFGAGEFETLVRLGQQYAVEVKELEAMAKKRSFPRGKHTEPA
jgi:Mn-dependent DtxR family transcriptional regulator